jgi:hypothetical protein
MQVALEVKAESDEGLQLSVTTSTLNLVDDLRPLDPEVFHVRPSPPSCPPATRYIAPCPILSRSRARADITGL